MHEVLAEKIALASILGVNSRLPVMLLVILSKMLKGHILNSLVHCFKVL